jgi:PPOX class probable F420-dependent enzyme
MVPVVFTVDGRRIVTAVDQKPKRTRRLQRLRHIAANPAVSVLVDRYDEDWRRLWWVRADGRARIVSDGDELATVIAALTARYPQYAADPPGGPGIVIDVERITGWAAGEG